jgi:para-aminobenzoate synthetase/4-amino-4-deoxychorismate lyase
MNGDPTVLFDSFDRQRDSASYSFTGLTEAITARSPAEVVPALRGVEAAVARGFHAAGFISYEAAAGLDPVLVTHAAGPLPLLWFGIFATRTTVHAPKGNDPVPGSYETGDWRCSVSAGEHAVAIARIREYIAAGDAYQVNFTLRQRFRFAGEPAAFYRDLCRSQQASFCAFLDIGRFQLLSASPELFFRLRDGLLTVRPMKGTAPRGRWWQEDEEIKQRLREDPKERAENLMIVDLLRNDLGMVAETGSVRVESLFDLETLPTLHQLTSTVTARPRKGADLVEIVRALFPCGSVTGAPKKRAMEIIKELENSPRGIYTGCIGYVSPPDTTHSTHSESGVYQGGEEGATQAYEGVRRRDTDEANAGRRSKATAYEAAFSVAIRTVLLDSATGAGELGVGSGVTWDSRANTEFAECLAKGLFATESRPEFQLIETMLWEEESGYFLLERHMERLKHSAAYFGFTFRPTPARRALARRAAHLAGSHKVRLLLSPRGTYDVETEQLPPAQPDTILSATFARTQVDSRDPFLYHKTTNRTLYREELAARPDCAEVIFLNERGEVTEGTTSNIVAKLDGALVTPPIRCGLLPGVFREELLSQGVTRERVITKVELERAEEIYLVNSVRRWRQARFV